MRVELKRSILAGVVLLVVTIVVFWRAPTLDFLTYDDPDYVTLNPIVQKGLSWEGVRWAFGNLHGEQTYWHPLTWMSHMLDVQLFGVSSKAHHSVNLFFHTANVLLLFVVLQTATATLWRSAFVALLFAIHPLQVESVAWVTERKNVLSTFFLLLTLWSYIRYARTNSLKSYVSSVCFYAIGLMCKPALVPLPILLIVLDYWPLGRISFISRVSSSTERQTTRGASTPRKRFIIADKICFVILACAASLMTILAHRYLGMIGETGGPPRSLELQNIPVAYVTYLRKLFWPSDLAIFYPFPTSISAEVTLLCILLLFGLTIAVLWQWRRRPFLVVGWVWFLAFLLPTIGFIRVGIQAMADRFAYVSLIGCFVGLVWGFAELMQHWRVPQKVINIAATIVVLILAALTMRQVSFWKNDYTVFEHARLVTENNYLAVNTVGRALLLQGDQDGALKHFEIAQQIRPTFPDVYYSMGILFLMRGDVPAAAQNLARALDLKPNYPEARLNFALALQTLGRFDDSIANYELYLQSNPESVQAHFGLGNALMIRGHSEQAISHLRTAIQLEPRAPAALARLAWILATTADSRFRSAPEAFRLAAEACRLSGTNDVQSVNALAAAHAAAGEFDLALAQADSAIRLAIANNQTNLVPVINSFRSLYEKHQPVVEGQGQ
jgi:Flp pilus assembly protein TadD